MDKKKYLTNKRYVIIIAVFCSILWGSAFPVLKISYSELSMVPSDMAAKIVLAGIRFLGASIILFLLILFGMKQPLKIQKNDVFKLLVLGLLQTTLQYLFFYNGLQYTSGMKAAILNSIGNFFVVILAHFIYNDDKINGAKIIGLITGFGGIVLVNWGQSLTLDFTFKGEGFLIISAIFSSIGIFVAKDLSKTIHPFLVTAWQMFLGSIVLLIFGLPKLTAGAIKFTPMGFTLTLYTAFLSAVAYALWYALLKYNKAGEITLYKFVTPLSGAILSIIFIPGEKFTIYIFFALALVVAGIIAINYNPYRSKKTR